MRLAGDRATMAGDRSSASNGLQSEISRLQDELEQQQRSAAKLAQSVEQFASELAHDLKNPLGAMRVNVQALKRSLQNGKVFEPAQLSERLDRLERAIDQALELLASGRTRLDGATAPRSSLRRETVDLVALVRAQVEALAPLVGETRISLEQLCPALLGAWDGHRVSRVIRELLQNALKFSPQGGCVKIALRQNAQENAAEVSVADQGIGIPPRDVPHVCERFYRADNVVGRYPGAGLGLFEVQRCVVDHEGSLLIESDLGTGSTVTLRLPLHP